MIKKFIDNPQIDAFTELDMRYCRTVNVGFTWTIAEIYFQVSKGISRHSVCLLFFLCVSLYFLLAGMDSSKPGGAISPI